MKAHGADDPIGSLVVLVVISLIVALALWVSGSGLDAPGARSPASGATASEHLAYVARLPDGPRATSRVEAVPGVTVVSGAADPLRDVGWVEVRVADADALDALSAVADAVEPVKRTFRIPTPISARQFGEFRPLFDVDPWVGAQWQNVRIGAPDAWARSTGAGQLVAVIDTGADCSHGELFYQRKAGLPGYDATTGQVGCPGDGHGHGTHVSGAIAAAMNGVQGAGVAPGSWFLPVKVLSDSGWGTNADIARGVVYATASGATVQNMSLGGPEDSQVLHDAIINATRAGIVVVVAAGNSGSQGLGYPASWPEVVAVGATDKNDARPNWSNYGLGVEIGAPGVETFSTTKGGGYGFSSGTSMSSPVVAGAVAVLRGLGIKQSAVLQLMQDTSSPCNGCQFASGRLDLGLAVATIPSRPTATPTATQTVKPPTAKPPTPTASSVVPTPGLTDGCYRIERISCP